MDEGKAIGKLETVDEGADSRVFSINKANQLTGVVKLYDQMGINNLDPHAAKEVLKQYYIDTEKVADMLEGDPNPLEQSIKINDEKFVMEYKIVLQGPMILKKEEIKKYLLGSHIPDKRVQASVGQKFISGLNLSDLIDEDDFDPKGKFTDNQIILINNEPLCMEIQSLVQNFFYYISQELDAHLSYASMNVKPFINYGDKKVEIFITDLASSLLLYYKHSPKFEELRKQS